MLATQGTIRPGPNVRMVTGPLMPSLIMLIRYLLVLCGHAMNRVPASGSKGRIGRPSIRVARDPARSGRDGGARGRLRPMADDLLHWSGGPRFAFGTSGKLYRQELSDRLLREPDQCHLVLAPEKLFQRGTRIVICG
jgi:hypothetical protein